MRYLRTLYRSYIILRQQFGFNIFAISYKMVIFFLEYLRYKKISHNDRFSISAAEWYPCLSDKTEITPIDPVYFYQDAWAAGKIFAHKPEHHYDVGSAAKTVAILSQFVPTTMIDIRPVELHLENLHFKKGSILSLPFEDNSIGSISSLCVVEHIGLGRYGDPLDQFGSEKAIVELTRVIKPGGYIYFSVPIGNENKVFFNAHRIFAQTYISELFHSCDMVEDKYIVNNVLCDSYSQSSGYTVGLFMFTKR